MIFFPEGSFSNTNFPSRDLRVENSVQWTGRHSQVDIHLMNPGFPDPMVEMALFFSEDANLLGKHFWDNIHLRKRKKSFVWFIVKDS